MDIKQETEQQVNQFLSERGMKVDTTLQGTVTIDGEVYNRVIVSFNSSKFVLFGVSESYSLADIICEIISDGETEDMTFEEWLAYYDVTDETLESHEIYIAAKNNYFTLRKLISVNEVLELASLVADY